MDAETNQIVKATEFRFKAVVFDLDGVVVQTAQLHAEAWKRLFDDFLKKSGKKDAQGNIQTFEMEDYLKYVDGLPRHVGVENFLKSRGIHLPLGTSSDGAESETIQGLGGRKDGYFLELLESKGAKVFESSVKFIESLRLRGIKTAVASSSRNCLRVLKQTQTEHLFDVRVDGIVSNALKLKGKPHGDIFVKSCQLLNVSPQESVVVEDAVNGVMAGRDGKFGLVLGIDRAQGRNRQPLLENGACIVVEDLSQLSVDLLNDLFPHARPRWTISFEGVELKRNRLREALCTLGNGYFATRGAQTEVPVVTDVDSAHYPATYMAGIFNRVATNLHGRKVWSDEMVNCPNWLHLTFRKDGGAWFDWRRYPDRFEVTSYEQQLNVHEATLVRRYRVRDLATGDLTSVLSTRFVSLRNKHLAGIKYIIIPENWSGRLQVLSSIDGSVENKGVPRYKDLNSKHLKVVETGRMPLHSVLESEDTEGDQDHFIVQGLGTPSVHKEGHERAGSSDGSKQSPSKKGQKEEETPPHEGEEGAAEEPEEPKKRYEGIFLRCQTSASRIEIAMGARTRLFFAEELATLAEHQVITSGDRDEVISEFFGVDTRPGDILVVEKLVSVHTSRDRGTFTPEDSVFRDFARMNHVRFSVPLRQHQVGWKTIWNRAHLQIACASCIQCSSTEGDSTGSTAPRSPTICRVKSTPSLTADIASPPGCTDVNGVCSVQSNQLDLANLRPSATPPESIDFVTGKGTDRCNITPISTISDSIAIDSTAAAARYLSALGVNVEERFPTVARELSNNNLSLQLATSQDLVIYHNKLMEEFEKGMFRLDCFDLQFLLRFHIFHMVQTCSKNTIGLDAGIPARGLHGESYRGHIFWDELFVYPVITLMVPELTRSLLLYRYHRLPAARDKARKYGCKGALFSWQSASSGLEETPDIHYNPVSGTWYPDNSQRQLHVNHAVFISVWKYFEMTGDIGFMELYGTEMLLEICRFWVDMVKFNPTSGRYDLEGVMGPDEFHEAYPGQSGGGLKNNAYTNIMVVYSLMKALKLLEIISEIVRHELEVGLQLTEKELQKWEHITRRMTVSFDENYIIEQFEGWSQLKELDFQAYKNKYTNIQRMDRILVAEGDSPNNYKVCKQADVCMIFYLLPEEEVISVFERLGYPFNRELMERNIEYYLAHTTHGSTLSQVVFSGIIHRFNVERSWQMYTEFVMSDICDIQRGTTEEGIHIVAMAASVHTLIFHFAGVDTSRRTLRFNPALPKEIERLVFNIQYLHQWLSIELTHTTLRITPLKGVQERVDVIVQNRAVQPLLPNSSVEFTLLKPEARKIEEESRLLATAALAHHEHLGTAGFVGRKVFSAPSIRVSQDGDQLHSVESR